MSIREEAAGKYFMGGTKENYSPGGVNMILPENEILRMAEKQRREKELAEANRLFLLAQEQKQKELNEKLERLELLPMGPKVILLPYASNPYRKIMEGNIIVDFKGEFNNPDSGEKDTLDTFVGCAQIIEVGPECKYLQKGDDVFYDTRTVYPLPFMQQGYRVTVEPSIIAVINEGLKARFKME